MGGEGVREGGGREGGSKGGSMGEREKGRDGERIILLFDNFK